MSQPDAESGIAELRLEYRPKRVTTLFVGESSPAGGTHFYRANSNLYRATQAAFAEAFGEDRVPSGEAFLRFFARKGCWLVDLADRPVNRLGVGERRAAVKNGVAGLAELMAQVKPKRVVVIKRDILPLAEQAVEEAGLKNVEVIGLAYPLRQWRQVYVEELSELLAA